MRRSVVVLYMRDIWGLMYTERTYTENRMDEWIEWMVDNGFRSETNETENKKTITNK